MDKRYNRKIDRIRGGQYSVGDFILADAKDSDLAGGVRTTGPRRDGVAARIGWRSRPEFLQAIAQIVSDDNIDVMLLSVSNMHQLGRSGAVHFSAVQLAFRANDTSDVWGAIRHGAYLAAPSRPFRSANLSLAGGPETLAFYSITFNNSLEHDLRSLEAFAVFRAEARALRQRYFLEIFNPNVDCGLAPNDMADYVNDYILRMLAGLRSEERPEFLKVALNGPEALQELAVYDPSLVVGLLGGGAGTARDVFELVAQGERCGAHIALFGRKITFAEDERLLISFLRKVADRELMPREAVSGYHDALRGNGKTPERSLEEDLTMSSDQLRQAAYQ